MTTMMMSSILVGHMCNLGERKSSRLHHQIFLMCDVCLLVELLRITK